MLTPTMIIMVVVALVITMLIIMVLYLEREPEVTEEGIVPPSHVTMGGCMNTAPVETFITEWDMEEFEEMEEEDDEGDEYYFSENGDEDLISLDISNGKEKES